MTITEESAEAFVRKYSADFSGSGKSPEQWEAYVKKYYKEDTLFVRPSGNPLTNKTYVAMLTSGDVQRFKDVFVRVEEVRILAGGQAAVVFYTTDQYFTFKGTRNEDRAKLSLVLEEVDGEIKIAYGHRCTGQPIPKDTSK